MEIKIRTDFSGQIAKSAILRNVPRAFKANATDWAGDTILAIKRSYQGGKVFKRPPKEFDQRLAQKVFMTGPEQATIVLGTGGYVGKNPVVFARIQEEGGVTHPTVTPRLRKWAWWMFYKTKDEKFKGMALSKKSKFIVTLKARHWFSTPIDARRPLLDMAMKPETVWATAQAMSQGYVPRTGG